VVGSCAVQHKRIGGRRKRRITASFWMWQEQRALPGRGLQNRWPLGFYSPHLPPPPPCVGERPADDFIQILDDRCSWTTSPLSLRSWWWWWWPKPLECFAFFPIFSSFFFYFFFPFFLLNVHIQSALDRSALVHIVRTTKMQDGWTDNGSIETLYIDFSCLPPRRLLYLYIRLTIKNGWCGSAMASSFLSSKANGNDASSSSFSTSS
jgi:hypothetical protein